jgi:hypothetical protein
LQSLANWRALLDCSALLDVLENLRIAGLEADDEQAATGFFHGLERFAVGGDARGAGPCQIERLELFAQLDGATFWMLKVSSSKKNSFTSGKFSLAHFSSAATSSVDRLRQAWPAQRLRPEAEGALRRAAARGVERDVRVQQERHVVAGHVHVALVDLGGPGHRVEVFNLRAVGIVHDLAVDA